MKFSLRRQMIIYFSAAFSIVSVIFGVIILSINMNSYRSQAYADCRKIVESNILLIDNYFQQLKNVSNINANDADVAEALSYWDTGDAVDYTRVLDYQRLVSGKISEVDVLGNINSALIIGNNYRAVQG